MRKTAPGIRALFVLTAALGVGCSHPAEGPDFISVPGYDAGRDASPPPGTSSDAAIPDAAMQDAGAVDGGIRDAAPVQGGSLPDASTKDGAVMPDAQGSSDIKDATMVTPDTGADAAMTPNDAAVDAARDASTPPDPNTKFVGNITTGGQVRSDFATYWNQITPENEGKWASVEAQRDQMNWTYLDRIRDYAKQRGLILKAHTFVWGSPQGHPGWLASLPVAEQRAEVEEWIRLFCERYPEVALIDVVNEPPPHTTPTFIQALGGSGASNWDWIVQTFKWARQYCPKAILILNDYNNIEYADQNAHFISIAKAVKAAGAPIDAVGAQAHAAFDVGSGVARNAQTIAARTAEVKRMLDKLASETSLPVYITEYDIDEANDQIQKQIMEAQFPMFWSHPAVKGITLWGYIVGATWVDNSGLMTASGQPRPAMTWLRDFLQQQR